MLESNEDLNMDGPSARLIYDPPPPYAPTVISPKSGERVELQQYVCPYCQEPFWYSEGKGATNCSFCSRTFVVGSGWEHRTLPVCYISLGALFSSIGIFLIVAVLIFAQTMWTFLWTGLFCGIGVGALICGIVFLYHGVATNSKYKTARPVPSIY